MMPKSRSHSGNWSCIVVNGKGGRRLRALLVRAEGKKEKDGFDWPPSVGEKEGSRKTEAKMERRSEQTTFK